MKCSIRSVKENRKRAYHIPLDDVFDALILVPEESWGEGERVPVISFDFL